MTFKIITQDKIEALKKTVSILSTRIKTGVLSKPTIAMIHECVELLTEMTPGIRDGLQWASISRAVDNAESESFMDVIFSKEV